MLDRLRQLDEGLRRTRDRFFGPLATLFDQRTLDEALWEELEELLIAADVGIATTEKLLRRLRQRVKEEGLRDGPSARRALQEEMARLLLVGEGPRGLDLKESRLNVILAVGVNGTGKTTTIAKLAHTLQGQGHRVALAAADTFRAAAIDQLRLWGERVGAPVIGHEPGADPGAVVYDAMRFCQARGYDVLIIDTAGRLHTKYNLMEELKKVRRVTNKLDPNAPHEVLLVLDATTGQNALAQARHFHEAVGVTGLVLAKLDGTAKGGAVFAIAQELSLPIKLVGTGEKAQDLAEFDPQAFVVALFRPEPPLS